MDGGETAQPDVRHDVTAAESAVEQRECDAREQGLGWEEAEECGVPTEGSEGVVGNRRMEAGSGGTTQSTAVGDVAGCLMPHTDGGAFAESEAFRDGDGGATEAGKANRENGVGEDLTAGIVGSIRGIAFSPLHPVPSPSALHDSPDGLRLPAAPSSPGEDAEACEWVVRADDSGLAVSSSNDEMSARMERGAALQERYMDMAMLADMEEVLVLDGGDGAAPSALAGRGRGRTAQLPFRVADGRTGHEGAGSGGGAAGEAVLAEGEHVARVDVVGSRLAQGEVSLGDRLVGVRSHAVYRMRVRVRAGREWQVERRFRELVELQQHMRALLDGDAMLALPYSPLAHSHALSPPVPRAPHPHPPVPPSPVAVAWHAVREEAGRFLGGASASAVLRRSHLLQSALSALLAAGPPLSTAPPLLSFLAHPIMQHTPWAALASAPSPDAPPGAWAPPPLLGGGRVGTWLGGGLSAWLPPALPGVPSTPPSRRQGNGDAMPLMRLGGGEMEEESGEGGRRDGAEGEGGSEGADLAAVAGLTGDRGGEMVRRGGGGGLMVRLSVEVVKDDEASVQRQMLLQRHCCAACRRPLLPDAHAARSSASALLFFHPLPALAPPVAAPRLCHYTGRIFCGACQGSDRCALPGLVLRAWCFDERPVCQLAKAYLDSTHDQPLLCLSAVNPLLPRRVPLLAHIQRLRAHLAVLHAAMGAACPLRRHLLSRLGRRAYLVQRETEGFFAMRDLVDASKGRFAVLPDMLARLASSLRRHMASGCIECAAAATTHCTAQATCCSPFGPLIFPYEVPSTSRCQHCSAAYHSCCLRRTRLCLLCAKPIQPSATPRTAASAPLVAPSPPTVGTVVGSGAAGSSREHEEEASGKERREGETNGQGGAGGPGRDPSTCFKRSVGLLKAVVLEPSLLFQSHACRCSLNVHYFSRCCFNFRSSGALPPAPPRVRVSPSLAHTMARSRRPGKPFHDSSFDPVGDYGSSATFVASIASIVGALARQPSHAASEALSTAAAHKAVTSCTSSPLDSSRHAPQRLLLGSGPPVTPSLLLPFAVIRFSSFCFL
ncbi:unnamed protein product [Closterium sp. NIES-54]